jgi:hypothetical protein
MLWALIKKEILDHLMSLRFAIACMLCLVVILCSVFVRSQDFLQVLDDARQEADMGRQRLRDYRRPWDLGWDGEPVPILRRPNPLKVFVRGMSDTNGGVVNVSTGRRIEPAFEGLTNPAKPLFPTIDLVMFVGLIMSLMALVFGYDAICGEKQRGTLRLMLSYSVPRDRVVIAKWIGGYVTLIVPFLLTALAGAVLVHAHPAMSLRAGQWARLGGVVGLAMLYVAAVFSLALYVSCLTRGPATSVMVLLSAWVILVLVVPNVSPHVAQAVLPVGSAREAEKQRQAAAEEIDERLHEKIEAYLERVGLEEEWWRDFPWGKWPQMETAFKLWIYETPLHGQARIDRLEAWEKIDQRTRRRVDAQIRLSRWIARVSPFSCFALASTELADAGVVHQRRFNEQLREYQIAFCRWIFAECQAMERKGLARRGRYPNWQHDKEEPMPVFRYVPPAAGDYARAAGVDAGILAGATLVLFMLSCVTFSRYDVR